MLQNDAMKPLKVMPKPRSRAAGAETTPSQGTPGKTPMYDDGAPEPEDTEYLEAISQTVSQTAAQLREVRPHLQPSTWC